MTEGPTAWLPGSFFRPPAWRWRRAEYLVAAGRRADRRVDDGWVRLARDFLRGRRGNAAVVAARDVWIGDSELRGEIEARLLTAEPLDRIAGRFDLSADVIEAYAEVYFDVGSMRRATDWLLSRAVGYRPGGGFTLPLPYAAWRLAALVGGPLLVDVVIAATTGRALPSGFVSDTGARRAAADTRARQLAVIWVGSMAARTPAEFAPVVRARRRLRAGDVHTTRSAASFDPWVAAMEAFLTRVTGCGRQPAATPAAETPAPERSKFFAQMVAEADAGGLRSRFEKKFPGLTFHVGRAGPVTMRPVDGGPAKAQVEVQLVVKDVTARYAEDRPRILAELEAYLKESLAASGMELNGPVHEKAKDGQKVGFWFGYESATHSGALTVDPQSAVIGSNLVTVAEDE